MKKFLSCFIAVLVFIQCSLLTGCSLTELEFNINDGYDEPIEEFIDPDYNFTVSCSLDKTKINLSGIGYYGDEAQLAYIKPYEYLYGEAETGICENTNATPNFVATYECEKEFEIEIDRFNEDGYDTVYCKFYVLDNNGEILAGPVYPTDITPINQHDEVVKVKGKKGIMCDDAYRYEVADLGCVHTELNFVISGMIVPLETYDEQTQQITPIEYEEYLDENGIGYIIGPDGLRQDVEAYVHNGTKYYFRTMGTGGYAGIYHFDDIISRYTRDGVKVTLIMLLTFNDNQYCQPYFISYPAARTVANGYRAINTSNPYGAGYWAALTEFVAKRYSQEDQATDARFGTVETFVIENEIDYSTDWNAIVDLSKHEPIDTEDYTIEFERTLRIANQSIKTAFDRDVALISFTHFWKYKSGSGQYSPKDILDIVASKTRKEGNYNWGLAAHPYGYDLTIPNFWKKDLDVGINGSLNTTAITWTNLEVLQLYLEQPTKLCNGEIRDVYITEGGVSTCATSQPLTDSAKNQQAAGVAYAYYKCTQLSCIKALIYYRLIDNVGDNCFFGLLSTDYQIKPAYEVYKFIDTQYSFDVTAQYYSFITWSRYIDGTLLTFPEETEPSFQNVMAICPSNFDWSTHWDENLIIVRETDQDPPITQV